MRETADEIERLREAVTIAQGNTDAAIEDYNDAKNEIERLQAENNLMAHCEGVTRDAIRKQVIEDMREYLENNRGFLGAKPFLDAYAKDRGIDEIAIGPEQ
jgi:SepF-like predicted cell division protein (DUF552 family)